MIPGVDDTAANMFPCRCCQRVFIAPYSVGSTYALELSPLKITQFLALAVICRTVISKLTNARGLSDIDRQVCLRPGLPVSLNLQLVRESSRPRHIDIPRPTSTTSRTKPGVRGHAASSAPCSTAPRRCNRRPPPFVRWREVESRDGRLLALMIGEKREKHPQLGCNIVKLEVKKI